MISVSCVVGFFLCGLVYSSGQVVKEDGKGEVFVKDQTRRPLTDTGFLRYGDPFYVYPTPEERRLQAPARDPTFTNEIENPQEPQRRPLFIFTTADAPLSSQQLPPGSGPYIEIRKKRSVEEKKPTDPVVGLLRKKRSHCSKCGGGGYGGGGGYYPVSYQVYPVYTSYVPTYTSYVPSYPSYGGGGGCNYCGKGGGGFGGGGSSGSWSKSSSSSKSSSGSWGYGR